MNIGHYIKISRKKNNLTQAKLAELVNLSTKHIQNIESNKYLLSLDKFVEICKVLDVTPNYLLQDDIDRAKEEQFIIQVAQAKKYKQKELKLLCNLLDEIMAGELQEDD